MERLTSGPTDNAPLFGPSARSFKNNATATKTSEHVMVRNLKKKRRKKDNWIWPDR